MPAYGFKAGCGECRSGGVGEERGFLYQSIGSPAARQIFEDINWITPLSSMSLEPRLASGLPASKLGCLCPVTLPFSRPYHLSNPNLSATFSAAFPNPKLHSGLLLSCTARGRIYGHGPNSDLLGFLFTSPAQPQAPPGQGSFAL